MTCHQQDRPASCEFWSLLSFTCGAVECHVIIKMVLSNRHRQRVVLAAGGLKLFNLTLANCSLLGRTECDRSTVFKAQGGTAVMTPVWKEGLGLHMEGAGEGAGGPRSIWRINPVADLCVSTDQNKYSIHFISRAQCYNMVFLTGFTPVNVQNMKSLKI